MEEWEWGHKRSFELWVSKVRTGYSLYFFNRENRNKITKNGASDIKEVLSYELKKTVRWVDGCMSRWVNGRMSIRVDEGIKICNKIKNGFLIKLGMTP